MKSTVLLSICCALLLIALGWTATRSMERIDALKAHITTVQATAERWRVTAGALQHQIFAQDALSKACLQREADMQADVALRDSIMNLAPPVPIAPPQHPQQQMGISDETRRAAADYLNRSL